MKTTTKTITLTSKLQARVRIGNWLLSHTLKQSVKNLNPSQTIIIADTHLPHQLIKQVSLLSSATDTILITAGEKSKSFIQFKRLLQCFSKRALDRHSVVIALGGGMIGDLSGFAAAVFLRGIRWINIPTTLLAQVDSSLGGKTGINFAGAKNIVGAFHHPTEVIIDPSLLTTLSLREFRSGVAEVIKYSLILDQALFHKLEQKPLEKFSLDALTKVIATCCQLKLKIVESDYKEGGKRAVLNFGHTVGHAIESVDQFNHIRHGEALAVGIVAASLISQQLGFLNDDDLRRIKTAIQINHLSVTTHKKPKFLFQATLRDKKRLHQNLNWILLERIGQAIIHQKVDPKLVAQTLEVVCR